jgi:hypothetical protein
MAENTLEEQKSIKVEPSKPVSSFEDIRAAVEKGEFKKVDESSIPDASTLDRLKYGFDKSTWMIGDLGRLAESHLTGRDIKEIEAERLAEIEEAHRHLSKRDRESTAATIGEVGGEVFDPTYFIPYFGQIGAVSRTAGLGAKAVGRLKSGTATGSLVAADAAIDSLARGNEINSNQVALAGLFGFAGGAAFGARAKEGLGVTRPDALGMGKDLKNLPKLLDGEVTKQEQDIITRVLKEVDQTDEALTTALKDVPNVGRVIAASNKVKQEYVDKVLDIAKKEEYKFLSKKEGIYKIRKKDRDRIIAQVPEDLQKANHQANSFIKHLPEHYDKYSTTLAESIFGTVERLAKEDTFNANIFARAVTRPLMGGIAGYGVGVTGNFISEEDTMSPWGWALAGLTMGQLSKKILKSNLSVNVKEEGIKGIEDLARRNIWAQANQMFAGSHAAKLDAYGGDLATFSKLIYPHLKGGTGQSWEETTSRVTQQLSKRLTDSSVEFSLEGAQGLAKREAAFKLANGFTDEASLAASFKPKEVAQIKGYATSIGKFVREFSEEVKNVGIDYKDIDNYGLPQMHDLAKIMQNKDEAIVAYTRAFQIQQPGLAPEAALITATKFIEKMLRKGNLGKQDKKAGYSIRSAFSHNGSYKDHALEFRPLTDHFEKARKIKVKEARMEIEDFLIKDPDQLLKLFLDKTVDKVEFARIFGAKGEGIQSLKRKIYDETKEALSLTQDPKLRKKLEDIRDQKIKEVHNTVDSMFGLHGAKSDLSQNDLATTSFGLMTTMANLTYLPKATIAAMGDVIQPFQNSGIYSGMKGIGRSLNKEKDFSSMSGFADKDVLGQELRQFVFASNNLAGAPGTKTQDSIRKVNENFFRMIGLSSVTQHAGRFAYNAGIEDGFKIAKKLAKGNRSSGLMTQAKTYNLTDDIVNTLNKFKTVDEAFADKAGKEILDSIGGIAARRDRIIPELGNRRLFTQSKDPFVRSLGQFMSWAQAKSTQLNSLVSRIEDGDAALAARMLGTLVLYDGVLTFKDFLNDPLRERDTNKVFRSASRTLGPTDYAEKAMSMEQLIGRSAIFSGNFAPWQVDKVSRIFAGAQYGEPLESVAPTWAWASSLVTGVIDVGKNIKQGDIEGATYQAIKRAPLGREGMALSSAIEGRPILKDRRPGEGLGQGVSTTDGNLRFAKGGMVCGVIRKKKDKGGIALVPNAPAEPDQRIDKITGLPYDEQAGEAYTDVEDRQGLIASVLGKKLQGQASV